ncbi:MAG: dTDP-4-dehydrorhamnose reductase [Spirochaetales bacterium]|nr:dTDP-4-dehydrorhamnose reductase [Spirochaetales bacterium]
MVWLVGSGGMLGTEVASALENKELPFCATDLDVDITDRKAVADFTAEKAITWIVNCAAYTAVDDAEDNEDLAHRINAVGPGILAKTADRLDATMIHISTDYVFNGEASVPYEVDVMPDPRSVYGETKLAGEASVHAATKRYFIVRTAWLFGKNGKNFVSTMLNLMQNRNELKVVSDQRGTPTYVADLAHTLTEFIRRESDNYGMYHYTNEGSTNWYEFACEIYATGTKMGIITNLCDILPVPSSQYPTKASRPAYSVLSRKKIESELDMSIPEWKHALDRFLSDEIVRRNQGDHQNE